ncbi:MAG: exonuclease SbcD [Kangiellaceae bacterium]
MRFIHTSDWHIGRQFHNVSLIEDQRHVLNQLLGYIETQDVDAVVIAGDIYDRSIPPAIAVDLLDQVLTKITMELGVPVILIPGNHDSAQRVRFGSKQLRQSGLHILGDLADITRPVVISSQSGEVAFYGIPYTDPEMVRNFSGENVSSYDEAHTYLVNQISKVKSSNQTNVLISHCFIDGAEESDSERPLSIGGSDRVSYQPCEAFNYVALGHLHAPQYKGAPHIRYSGSILKYSFSEHHQKKGITLVDLDKNGTAKTTHLHLLPLRDMRIIEGELATILEQGKLDPHNQDYLLIRMTDRQAILEPMARLRDVYPNVLQLEKPGMLITGDQIMSREKLKRGELDMFRDFFVQVSGQTMTPAQDSAIEETICALLKHQDEA